MFYGDEMSVIIVVIVVIVILMFVTWAALSVKKLNSPGMSGGALSDVIEKIQSDKLRSGDDEYKDVVKRNVMNGIEAFKEVRHIDVKDEDIEYVGQGFQNVVVRLGRDGPLLRVAKYIKPFMFKQFQYTFNMLRKHDSGFLTPSFFRYGDGDKQFIVWEIKELKEVKKFDYDKLKNCTMKVLKFLNRSDVGLSYIDFKCENVMMDDDGEYLNADFDLYAAFDVRNNMKNEKKALSVDELKKEMVGKTVNYCGDQSFVKKVLLTYFKNGGDGEIDFNSLDEKKYNPKVLYPSLFARLFMLKMELEPEEHDSVVTVTEDIIDKMVNMKSTDPSEVLSW